ncbi:hypothetical protein EC973_008837 [Apophysomyces ossiformis]|uniref:Large ribosomal subunit protein mL44 n=1 Tax=Apophysomyces ossiformis TaxID=679940 RepID=A0A8H7ETS7_9FUNG|nr:hypothetical protein EC973_008837 [Apophysomyces ossiformis]
MITARHGRTLMLCFALFSLFFTFALIGKDNVSWRRPYDYDLHVKRMLNVSRERAAFVVLARNDELNRLRETMQQMEDRFNHKRNYPWVFLNDQPFTDKFKRWTRGMSSGQTYYGLLNSTMWGYPDWIDQEKALQCREEMKAKELPYAGEENYHHMCRFQSGYFFRHPLLDQFDYYWRVEPGVQFLCDIDYDPFQFMQANGIKYGWSISILEYANTIPTLWDTVKAFMSEHPEHIIPKEDPNSLMEWISNDGGNTYNLCHFWNNFEIGYLPWFRSKAYMDYFDYLDKSGGFYYERWGDAPVHSIAAALMLKKSEVHWFYDIGYRHDPFYQCPREPSWLPTEKCSCDPTESFVVPRMTTAALHRSSVRNQEVQSATATTDNVEPALYAFDARLKLNLSPTLLEKAVTHKSLSNESHNSALEFIGKRAIGLFTAEYFHSKYPTMHAAAFDGVLDSLLSYRAMSNLASQMGLQHVVRQAPEEKRPRVLAECLNAVVGALYQEQGPEAVKRFVHAHIISRDLDIRPLIKLPEPKRHLTRLLVKLGKEPAVSRTLSETGRLSNAPVFVVGVFSGQEKLGEGFGSSLKMAEYRACQDALYKHYGKEEKDFMLPSDADHVEHYQPPKLGDTEAII